MNNYIKIIIAIIVLLAACGYVYYYKYKSITPEGEVADEEEMFDIPEEIPQKKNLEPHQPETMYD